MNALNLADRAEQAEQIVSAIALGLSLEFDSMRELLDGCGGSDVIDVISTEMNAGLSTIRGLIAEGQILPQ